MSGDTANAALWQNADVYKAPSGTAGPADVATPWAVAWEAAGLLDGEEGFTESRDEDSSEFYAWGGILVKKTKSKHKRTIKFVAMEDNPVVFDLVNPGSTRSTDAGGLTTSTVKVPTNAEFAIGFETRDGDKIKRRMVKRATVETIGEIKESESEPTVYEITVVLYPEADGTLYTEVSGTYTAS
jgi:hypothetical protein